MPTYIKMQLESAKNNMKEVAVSEPHIHRDRSEIEKEHVRRF